MDAAFSKIADRLRRTDVETLPDLISILPNIEVIDHIYDIRGWLLPHLENISDHTKPHHYRFLWNINKRMVDVAYRGTEKQAWKPLGFRLFKTKLPNREPKRVVPDYGNMRIERVENHLKHWECLFSDQLERKEVKWWRTFVADIKSKHQAHAKDRNGIWLLPHLPRQTMSANADPVEIPEAIRKLLEQERLEPEASIYMSVY